MNELFTFDGKKATHCLCLFNVCRYKIWPCDQSKGYLICI